MIISPTDAKALKYKFSGRKTRRDGEELLDEAPININLFTSKEANMRNIEGLLY